MWSYWLLFLFPAAMAYREAREDNARPPRNALRKAPLGWWLALLALSLVVGLRHEVGGDWFNYLTNFENAGYESAWDAFTRDDPGYRLIEWLALRLDWGIHGVNLLSALVFSYGLVVFCRHLPRPWLALAVAVPYLVIILGMGYSRQGIALGCIMAGLVALGRQRVLVFVLWVLLGATFHKSAVLLLPMAALAASQRKLVTGAWVAVVAVGAYVLLLEESVAHLQAGYLEAGYQSEGALVRLLMNALPAGLLLARRRRFAMPPGQQQLWFWFAMASLALLALYFVSPSSTAVDRVALYLLPLQLVVFSYAPEVLGRRQGNNRAAVGSVLLFYAVVQFVWLNFATHAFAWLPYRFYPLEGVF